MANGRNNPAADFLWKCLQPGIIVGLLIGVASIQYACLDSRFTSVETSVKDLERQTTQGLDHAGSRIDKIFDAQAGIARSLGAVEADTRYMRERIDKIADKLDVAAGPDGATFVKGLQKDPVKTLRDAGYKVERAKDALKVPETQVPAIMEGTDKGDWYMFDATKGDMKSR